MSKDAKANGLVVFVVVFVTAICNAGFSKEAPWQLECNLANGCLFNDGLFQSGDSRISPPDQPSTLSDLIFQIGDTISQGIVRSTFVEGSIATESTGIVELPLVISGNLDNDLTTRDEYWSYYEDCDRWGVSFVHFKSPSELHLPKSKSLRSSLVLSLNAVYQQAIDHFRYVEFQICECADQYSELVVSYHDKAIEPVERKESTPQIVKQLLNQYVANQPLLRALKLVHGIGSEQVEQAKNFIHTAADRFLTVTRDQISKLSNRANELF